MGKPDQTTKDNSYPQVLGADSNAPIDKTKIPLAQIDNDKADINKMLDSGVNGLQVDLYPKDGTLKTCHMLSQDVGFTLKLDFNEILNQVFNWLKNNQDEVVLLKLDNNFDKSKQHLITEAIKQAGNADKIVTPEDFLKIHKDGLMPNLGQIANINKQLVIVTEHNSGDKNLFNGTDHPSLVNSITEGVFVPAERIPQIAELNGVQNGNLPIASPTSASGPLAFVPAAVMNLINADNIKTTLAAVMPIESQVVFRATVDGLQAAKQYMQDLSNPDSAVIDDSGLQTAMSKGSIYGVAEIVLPYGAPLLKPMVEVTASGSLASTLAAATSQYIPQWVGSSTTSSTNFFSDQLVTGPILEMLKETLDLNRSPEVTKDGGKFAHETRSFADKLERGLINGMKNSLFGLFSFENIQGNSHNDMMDSIAKTLKNVVAKRPELLDNLTALKKFYEGQAEKVSAAGDFDYPSFNAVMDHVNWLTLERTARYWGKDSNGTNANLTDDQQMAKYDKLINGQKQVNAKHKQEGELVRPTLSEVLEQVEKNKTNSVSASR